MREEAKREANRTEYLQLCKAVSIGFIVMGFIGYLVKLIHIPMYVLSFPIIWRSTN